MSETIVNRKSSVVIINYGAGNVRSVMFALERLGVEYILTDDVKIIQNAPKVIFPGVGHAKPAMDALKAKGLDTVIKNLKQPVLGVCLGMQLMCSKSEEGNTEGLGIFDAEVVLFKNTPKVPHMGWNKLENGKSILDGIDEDVYFVHSYFVPESKDTMAICNFGSDFSAALQKDNFYGCQFHPEKSGEVGERILNNFIQL